MKSLQSLPVLVRLTLFVLPLLTVALVASAVYNPDAPKGEYVASPVDDCTGDSVCVEWEAYTYGGNYVYSDGPCCMSASMVGSTQYGLCDAYRTDTGPHAH